MKGRVILICISISLIAAISCKKENSLQTFGVCGNTGITGPVRYYLTPYDKSLFLAYQAFHKLIFVDSMTHDTTQIKYSSDAQIWDYTIIPSDIQGDTLDFGERAGIAYNHGTINLGNLEYYFDAYPNGADSLRIMINGSNPQQQYPTRSFSWTLNMADTNTICTTGYTPFILLDSTIFLSHTFYQVYLLQDATVSGSTDSSNLCYYTKANGIIAFTDKRYNRFWIRTNY